MFAELSAEGVRDVHFRNDPQSGLKTVLALHGTNKAIGGCRFFTYDQDQAAINDALRLARISHYKAALLDLPYSGAEAIILKPRQQFDRGRLFGAFGEFVESLGGRFVCMPGIGTDQQDMQVAGTRSPHVNATDPSPYTAEGVFEGIRALADITLGKSQLRGLHVCVQGLGKVGYRLARLLHQAGARLTVSDLEKDRARACRQELGADVVAPETLYDIPCDIFSPCGLGGVINSDTLPRLRCRIIAGCADRPLQSNLLGLELRQRDIVYAPDYLLNAGGLIFVASSALREDAELVHSRIQGIGRRLRQLLVQAEKEQSPPCLVAERLAETKLNMPQS